MNENTSLFRVGHVALAVIVAAFLVSPASGQDAVPDLTGTWVIEGSGVINPYGEENDDHQPIFIDVSLKKEVRHQRGITIAGMELEQKIDRRANPWGSNEVFVGVITEDGTQLSMVDHNGTTECAIVSSSELHCVYIHITPVSNLVSSTVWSKEE